MDVPRSVRYFGGLAAAVGLGLIEPPLAVFIAAVPVFTALTNSALPKVRAGADLPVLQLGVDPIAVASVRCPSGCAADVDSADVESSRRRCTTATVGPAPWSVIVGDRRGLGIAERR